jgi:hypothetical protein
MHKIALKAVMVPIGMTASSAAVSTTRASATKCGLRMAYGAFESSGRVR